MRKTDIKEKLEQLKANPNTHWIFRSASGREISVQYGWEEESGTSDGWVVMVDGEIDYQSESIDIAADKICKYFGTKIVSLDVSGEFSYCDSDSGYEFRIMFKPDTGTKLEFTGIGIDADNELLAKRIVGLLQREHNRYIGEE